MNIPDTTKGFRLHKTGGPEDLIWEEIPLKAPGPEEILVEHKAVGLNFIDIYHRTGLYPVPLPSGVGLEAAGIILACGSEVTDLKPGDRIAYCTGPIGAYAGHHILPGNRVVKLPDDITEEMAAASLLKGLTACYLLTRTYPVKAGDKILLHAAAGGVGLILSQWAAGLGAHVIGTAGSEKKAALARRNGCEEVILYREQDIARAVREFTDGKGVQVVYDSVGRDTFEASLKSLAPLGYMVSYGNASGPPPAVEPARLSTAGSLFLTRPSLMHYAARTEDLRAMADALFAELSSGRVKVNVNHKYSLQDAPIAQEALENRRTSGSSILIP